MRELVVLGTASQTPTRYRNQNGYLLRWDDDAILFDPGEGTQRQLLIAGVSPWSFGRICITHLHGDHCLGLPGVIQRLSLDRVSHPVEVLYPSSGQVYIERLLHAAVFEEHVDVHQRPVAGSGVVDSGPPFALVARRLDHFPDTLGWRLEEPEGRTMLHDRLEAAGIVGPAVGELQRAGAVDVGARRVRVEEMSVERPGQIFAFIMDTGMCDAAFELARGADLVVCEATFASAEADLAAPVPPPDRCPGRTHRGGGGRQATGDLSLLAALPGRVGPSSRSSSRIRRRHRRTRLLAGAGPATPRTGPRVRAGSSAVEARRAMWIVSSRPDTAATGRSANGRSRTRPPHRSSETGEPRFGCASDSG